MAEYQGRTVLDEEAVSELAGRIEGSVFVPGDAGYSAAVLGFNLCSRLRLCLVVAAATAAGRKSDGHRPYPVSVTSGMGGSGRTGGYCVARSRAVSIDLRCSGVRRFMSRSFLTQSLRSAWEPPRLSE
ncbi:hypothetical protein ABZT04_27430 [Streptomyces sp. NPDC005492]|uniref:hypothetical protein n=1 Tax=Streptomyces sp. NPDC005492 TaxID=3156883 RepID=UPI00339F2F59